MKVYNFQSLNQAYEKAKEKGLTFNPSRQAVEYRMKKLDMEKISRLILKAVKKFVVVDSRLIYYGRKKRRWTKLHVFYIRVPSYTDVASKKLKQDVESSWQCPFVSVSEEESEAQHAFCNVKKRRK